MDLQDVSNLSIPEGEVRNIHDSKHRLLWGKVSYDDSYLGNISQVTGRSNNLTRFPYVDDSPRVSNGITFETSSDGSVTINGQNNGSGGSTFMLMRSVKLPAGTYHIIPPSVDVSYTLYNGSQYYAFNQNNNYTRTFNSTTNVNQFYIEIPKGKTTVYNYDILYPMLTTISNPTQADWEEYYTIPNPGTPEGVDKVSGVQNIKIHGKNFISLANGTYASSGVSANVNDGKISITNDNTGTDTSVVISVNQQITIPAGTYTLSKNDGSAYPYLQIRDTNNTTIAATDDSHPTVSFTISEPKTIQDIELYFGSSKQESIFFPQLERGSSSTQFEVYQEKDYTINLGSIELYKIGAYQDKIYTDGTSWFIHKETNKIELDGSSDENWTYESSSAVIKNRWFLYQRLNDAKTSEKDIFISNMFTVADSISLGNSNEGFVMDNNRDIRIRWDMENITSVSSWRTFLSSHVTNIYYILDTPTDTQITDINLISQLDDVHQFLSRYGYSATVSGNLPIIIDRTNL